MAVAVAVADGGATQCRREVGTRGNCPVLLHVPVVPGASNRAFQLCSSRSPFGSLLPPRGREGPRASPHDPVTAGQLLATPMKGTRCALLYCD